MQKERKVVSSTYKSGRGTGGGDYGGSCSRWNAFGWGFRVKWKVEHIIGFGGREIIEI